jgi:hypothetical protein
VLHTLITVPVSFDVPSDELECSGLSGGPPHRDSGLILAFIVLSQSPDTVATVCRKVGVWRSLCQQRCVADCVTASVSSKCRLWTRLLGLQYMLLGACIPRCRRNARLPTRYWTLFIWTRPALCLSPFLTTTGQGPMRKCLGNARVLKCAARVDRCGEMPMCVPCVSGLCWKRIVRTTRAVSGPVQRGYIMKTPFLSRLRPHST